jgi:hypothetical protein
MAIEDTINKLAPMQLGATVLETLLREDWQLRMKQAVIFAGERVNRLRWKRGYKGPLPDGYDENSIAAEAIKQLFKGDCRITSVPYTKEQLDKEIMRLVANLAHALLRRQETILTRTEQDLEPASEENDRDCEMHRIKDDDLSPQQKAERSEAKAKLDRFKSAFNDYLDGDAQLTGVFDCVCNGIVQREEIAVLLDVTPQTVTNARKRLDRKLTNFASKHPEYPQIFIQEMIDV